VVGLLGPVGTLGTLPDAVEEVALLGTLPDAEVAARIGRTANAVRTKRWCLQRRQ
jgi:hypothetical protein